MRVRDETRRDETRRKHTRRDTTRRDTTPQHEKEQKDKKRKEAHSEEKKNSQRALPSSLSLCAARCSLGMRSSLALASASFLRFLAASRAFLARSCSRASRLRASSSCFIRRSMSSFSAFFRSSSESPAIFMSCAFLSDFCTRKLAAWDTLSLPATPPFAADRGSKGAGRGGGVGRRQFRAAL